MVMVIYKYTKVPAQKTFKSRQQCPNAVKSTI